MLPPCYSRPWIRSFTLVNHLVIWIGSGHCPGPRNPLAFACSGCPPQPLDSPGHHRCLPTVLHTRPQVLIVCQWLWRVAVPYYPHVYFCPVIPFVLVGLVMFAVQVCFFSCCYLVDGQINRQPGPGWQTSSNKTFCLPFRSSRSRFCPCLPIAWVLVCSVFSVLTHDVNFFKKLLPKKTPVGVYSHTLCCHLEHSVVDIKNKQFLPEVHSLLCLSM